MYNETFISWHQVKNVFLLFSAVWFFGFILLYATSENEGFTVILAITWFIAFIFTIIVGLLKGFDW